MAVEGGAGYPATAPAMGVSPAEGGGGGLSLWGWGLFVLVLDVELSLAVGRVAVPSTHPGCPGARWGSCAGVGELDGVLVLPHPWPRQSALGTCPEHLLPGPGSSGFGGFSDAQKPGRGGGGVMHPLPAQCTIPMTTMLEAAWMQAAPSLLYLLGYL